MEDFFFCYDDFTKYVMLKMGNRKGKILGGFLDFKEQFLLLYWLSAAHNVSISPLRCRDLSTQKEYLSWNLQSFRSMNERELAIGSDIQIIKAAGFC